LVFSDEGFSQVWEEQDNEAKLYALGFTENPKNVAFLLENIGSFKKQDVAIVVGGLVKHNKNRNVLMEWLSKNDVFQFMDKGFAILRLMQSFGTVKKEKEKLRPQLRETTKEL